MIKCVNGDADPQGMAKMCDATQGARIDIYDGYWSAGQIHDVMAACDAYVSLHRSEGTGLTITDALALGKPVIATGWSGNMDFMNVSNSFPVQVPNSSSFKKMSDRIARDKFGRKHP